MENIGDKIYKLRTDKKVSQEKLALELGVARQTVSKWEMNVTQPTLENVEGMCNYFCVDIGYFFGNAAASECGAEVSSAVGEENAAAVALRKTKFKTLKILTAVVGMVTLALFIIACGIAAYAIIVPDRGGKYVYTVNSVNTPGIICLVLSVIALSVFITLAVLFITKYIKNKKTQNVNFK